MIGAARAKRGENELLLLEFRELDTGAVLVTGGRLVLTGGTRTFGPTGLGGVIVEFGPGAT